MKRSWKLVASIAVIFVIGWTMNAAVSAKSLSEPSKQQPTYTVHGVDTLWSIVNSNHKYDGQDRNEVVYQIKQLNSLQDSQLQPGQILRLP